MFAEILRLCLILVILLLNTGAQSDSEISVSSSGTGVSEQGYISDSELYKPHKQHRSGSESDVSTASVNSTGWLMVSLSTLACILESGITLVHPHSRNKSDFKDLIFPCYVLQASYQLKTMNIVKSINLHLKI